MLNYIKSISNTNTILCVNIDYWYIIFKVKVIRVRQVRKNFLNHGIYLFTIGTPERSNVFNGNLILRLLFAGDIHLKWSFPLTFHDSPTFFKYFYQMVRDPLCYSTYSGRTKINLAAFKYAHGLPSTSKISTQHNPGAYINMWDVWGWEFHLVQVSAEQIHKYATPTCVEIKNSEVWRRTVFL